MMTPSIGIFEPQECKVMQAGIYQKQKPGEAKGFICLDIGGCDLTLHNLTVEIADALVMRLAQAADEMRAKRDAMMGVVDDGVDLSQPLPSM